MSNEWSVLLSSDDQEFIQTIQFYYDLFRDMNAEYSQKVFALRERLRMRDLRFRLQLYISYSWSCTL